LFARRELSRAFPLAENLETLVEQDMSMADSDERPRYPPVHELHSHNLREASLLEPFQISA